MAIQQKLTFAEYWKSKDRLIDACDEVPRIVSEYTLSKYCKIPVYELHDLDNKTYVSFKPNDLIKIHWEYHNLQEPTPKFIDICTEGNNISYSPCWNNKKMIQWVELNSSKL